MRTVVNKIMKFEELNEDQKKLVIEKYRDWNVEGSDWSEFTVEDAKSIGSLMGITMDHVYFSGFWSQGDGACFVGSFSHVKGIVKNVKGYAPQDKELHRIAKEIQDLHRKSFYSAYGKITHRGHYNHERSMDVDVECEKGAVDYSEWTEVFADLALWIYKRLEAEHEYMTSDEAVAESLISNEWEGEFDEDGDLVR